MLAQTFVLWMKVDRSRFYYFRVKSAENLLETVHFNQYCISLLLLIYIQGNVSYTTFIVSCKSTDMWSLSSCLLLNFGALGTKLQEIKIAFKNIIFISEYIDWSFRVTYYNQDHEICWLCSDTKLYSIKRSQNAMWSWPETATYSLG